MRAAICNELFCDPKAVGGPPWDWRRQCAFAAECGYAGLEVAPFTLGEAPLETPAADRAAMRAAAAEEGVEVVGLHWLLARTEGYHLTTADAAVRRRTGEYLAGLARLCADLGGTVMVLGSPQQRSLETGVSQDAAYEHAAEAIAAALPSLEDLGVTLCLEPLAPNETDFMTTCADGRRLIEAVGSPAVRLHQDVKAMLPEPTPIPQLIRQFADVTAHFHANDGNLRGPGMGETDFGPIADALKASGYGGWVSVEVFDYEPGAERTARESMACLRANGLA